VSHLESDQPAFYVPLEELANSSGSHPEDYGFKSRAGCHVSNAPVDKLAKSLLFQGRILRVRCPSGVPVMSQNSS
jgi:hypothetical protein